MNCFRLEWKSGSSKRNASCPLSVFISKKQDFALIDFKAERIVLVSNVGNNQSEVKEKKTEP